MKKTLLLMVCLSLCLLFVSTALAEPFLACDPMTEDVTQIDVNLSGEVTSVPVVSITKRADAWLLLDLSSIVAGSYTVKAKAVYGTWGESDWSSDFLFVKPVITAPANMSLK